jgi:hypothetical protein
MPTVAKARYTGQDRTHSRRGPSGKRYRFQRMQTGDTDYEWVEIEDAQDAEALADNESFAVEWTAIGTVMRKFDDAKQAVSDGLDDLPYTEKQQLSTALDLDVAGNAKEEELDEALAPVVEDLRTQMEMERENA